MKPLTSIIIPETTDSHRYTLMCLEAIAIHTDAAETPYEVIPMNTGSFTESVNKGVQQAKGEFIVVLNNDALVTRDWLKYFFITRKTLEERKMSVGIVGTYFTGLYGNNFDLTSNQYAPVFRVHKRIVFVNAFFKKSDFLEVGGMDENFIGAGTFGDDDISIRFWKAKYINVVAPIITLHFGHSSFSGPQEVNAEWKANEDYMKQKWGADWFNKYYGKKER